jgi:hypothetical protein
VLSSLIEVKEQMSTRITIGHGCNFHLLQEALDEDCVYLELEGTKFEASYNRVMLPIPVHVCELFAATQALILSMPTERAQRLDFMLSRRLTSESNFMQKLTKGQRDLYRYPAL